jgi:hypothetical protein
MLPSHPPTFIVNHGGVRFRCKDTLKQSDIRIGSYVSINLIRESMQIYCHHHQQEFTATTIDIWMYINLFVKDLCFEVPIEEFLSKRSKLEAEYREGLEVIKEEESLREVKLIDAHELEKQPNV